MAERNPTMRYRNVHGHRGTKTPEVCKCLVWRPLSFDFLATKAVSEDVNSGSGDGALLRARDWPLHLPYFLVVGWEEEVLVGARSLWSHCFEPFSGILCGLFVLLALQLVTKVTCCQNTQCSNSLAPTREIKFLTA